MIVKNKKASFDYFIEDSYEAGISLLGWEVKSFRAGKIQLQDAYITIKDSEVFLIGCNISPLLTVSRHVVPDPIRSRKILLRSSEINKLIGKVAISGYTLIPLSMYFKNQYIKLEVGLAKGKKQHDKRESEKERDWKREQDKILKKNSTISHKM